MADFRRRRSCQPIEIGQTAAQHRFKRQRFGGQRRKRTENVVERVLDRHQISQSFPSSVGNGPIIAGCERLILAILHKLDDNLVFY